MELTVSPCNCLKIGASLVVGFFILAVTYSYFSYYRRSKRSLKNRHVVVTGGSSGIGKSVACEAARRGANVTIIARNQEKLIAAKHEISHCCASSNQLVFTVSLDVTTDYEKVEKAMSDIEQEGGPIYMLVNCAGSAVCGKLEDTSPEDFKKMYLLNVVGSFFPTKAVIERMKADGQGVVVFVASQAALLGIFGYAAYSASKYALRGMAEALSMEASVHGVTVTISFPPDTDTPGFAEEEKTKPRETRLISNSAGLVSPHKVASKLLDDALAGVFMSSVGFEGFLLVTLCAGMSPITSFIQFLFEVCLMGVFRILTAFYLFSFQRTIYKCLQEKNSSKKAE